MPSETVVTVQTHPPQPVRKLDFHHFLKSKEILGSFQVISQTEKRKLPCHYMFLFSAVVFLKVGGSGESTVNRGWVHSAGRLLPWWKISD